MDWSPKHSELVLGAYYSRTLEAASPEADGVVLLWSTALQSRPEYVFSCQVAGQHCLALRSSRCAIVECAESVMLLWQSAVTAAQFCQFTPHLVVGGTYSGQIVLWDTRFLKLAPQSLLLVYTVVPSLLALGSMLCANTVEISVSSGLLRQGEERTRAANRAELVRPLAPSILHGHRRLTECALADFDLHRRC